MIEVAFVFMFAINVTLSILLISEKTESRTERAKMINAIVAKNATEMANLDMADKTEIKVNNSLKQPEFVPPENLSQEEWEKAIK